MAHPLGKKVAVAFGAALILLGLVGLFACRSTNRLAETAGWAAHVHRVSAKIDEITAALAEADAHRCNYAVTGDAEHLRACRERAGLVRRGLSELGTLLEGPDQQPRLRAVAALVERELGLLDISVRLREGRRPGPGQSALTREGKATLGAIGKAFTEIKAEESAQLEAWDHTSRRAARETLITLDVANVVAFAVLGLAIFGIRRDVRDWERRETTLRQAQRESAARAEEQACRLSQTRAVLEEQAGRCRQLEERFRQLQKMSAVGRLAGGVAHDFNNLLTVILNCGEAAAHGVPAGPARECLGQALQAAEQAAALTRQLLTFSRQQAVRPTPLDLNAVVTDLGAMLRRLIGRDVELVPELGPGLWAVSADRGQVGQVLMNLVVNARDAMPQGGRVTVRTANVEVPGPCGPGPHVLLAVSDTGCGMDEATRARVCEPFFTTKGEKGTGLGLATVREIVEQAGGHLAVESAPGQGTTVRVYLPRAAEEAPAADTPLSVRSAATQLQA